MALASPSSALLLHLLSGVPRRPPSLQVLLRNARVLRLVLGDAPHELGVLARTQQVRKGLVVRDDNELEVLLVAASHHDAAQRLGQARRVLCVQVGGGLVEGEDAAVEAERLGQCQADDEAGQHLLARTAAAAHLQLSPATVHHHPVVVGPGAVLVRLDLYVVNVLAAVRLLPQLLDDLVDVAHLGGVVAQQRLLQGLVILVQVLNCVLGGLDTQPHLVELGLNLVVLGCGQVLLGALHRLLLRCRLPPQHISLAPHSVPLRSQSFVL
mmetsp:Transcript_13702/g.29420  ORF Transcript_13702/g.29420 Transcript_13702/m.29420 type:complete len:268 (-) Transcript_13702:342-1145(-)